MQQQRLQKLLRGEMGGKLQSPTSPKQTSNAPNETPAQGQASYWPQWSFGGGNLQKGNGRGNLYMFTSNLLKSMNISSPEEKREEMVRKIKKRQEADDCYRQLETQNAQS